MIILLLYLIFIITSAYIDAEHINDKDFIEDHTSRWILRLIVTLGMAYDATLFYLFDWRYLIIMSFLFIALFDLMLNIFRDMGFFYLGTVAKWDVFWKKRIGLYKVIRIGTLISSVILIILLL